MAPRKPATGKEIVNWDEELAKQSEIAAGNQRASGGGGKFFSMKSGQLSFDGNPMPGNMMAVVILGYVIENSFYDTAYDPDVPASPKCFAFAEREEDLEPMEAVDKDAYFERQHDSCTGCSQNEWGSARTGRGKACSNVMRLAMIPAGAYKPKGTGRNAGLELELFDDPDHYAKAEVAYMKLPVMSVRNFSTFVKQLAGEVRRPPHGVITNVAIEPDPKSQFRVVFELVDTLGNDLLNVTMPRHKKEMDAIAFPYSPPLVPEEPTKAKTANKLTKRR